MGFGHRVYRSYDLTAKIMKANLKKSVRGHEAWIRAPRDRLELERIALCDELLSCRARGTPTSI